MNPLAKKQTVLKLALFAVLAANISYGSMKSQFGSMELMQVAASPRDARDGGGQAQAAPTAQAAATAASAARTGAPAAAATSAPAPAASQPTVAPATAAPAATAPAASAAPAQTAAAAEVISYSNAQANVNSIRVCKGTEAEEVRPVSFRFAEGHTYLEQTESDCSTCHIAARSPAPDTNELRVKTLIPGLVAAIEQLGCTKAKTAEELEEERREKEEKDLQVAKCELKKKRGRDGKFEYVEIDEDSDEHYECNLDRLKNVAKELELENGKKPTKTQIQARIDQIVKSELKGHVKELATSRDEDERKDGRELARELSREIERARDRNDLNGRNKWTETLQDYQEGSKKLDDLFSVEYANGMTREETAAEYTETAQELTRKIALMRAAGQPTMGAEMQLRALQRDMGTLSYDIDSTILLPLQALQPGLGEDYNSFIDPFNVFKNQVSSSWGGYDPATGLMAFLGQGAGAVSGVLPGGINPHRGLNSIMYTSRGVAGLPTTVPSIDVRAGGMSSFGRSAPLALAPNSSNLNRLAN